MISRFTFTIFLLLKSVCTLLGQSYSVQSNEKVSYFQEHENAIHFLHQSIHSLQQKGYLLPTVSNSIKQDSTLYALQKNKLFHWADVQISGNEKKIFQTLNVSVKNGGIVQYQQLLSSFHKAITYFEENGYPFASISFDSVKIKQDSIWANLKIDKGPKVVFNEIHMKGSEKIKARFLRTHLHFKKGDLYNERLIKSIPRQINALNYIQSSKSPEVVFRDGKADLYLYLQDKNANLFNGILGIIPPETNTQKVQLTGDIHLALSNILRSGEHLELIWKKPNSLNQRLQIKSEVPYLFKSPFGVSYQLHIHKQDSTFLETKNKIGVLFRLHSTSKLEAFYEKYNSSITRQVTTGNFNSNFSDVSTDRYGLTYQYTKLDRVFNPRKGIKGNVSFLSGIKKINSTENLPTSANQIDLFYNLHFYIPLLKRCSFLIHPRGGYLLSNVILQNEHLRFGGNQWMRGFNEESLKASEVTTLSLEFIYQLEEVSNVFFFSDMAWYKAKIYQQETIKDQPIGFGIGTSFQTAAGVIQVSYALGQQMGNPLLFSSGKIHFGLLTTF